MMWCDGRRNGWCDRWIPSQRRPLTVLLRTLLMIGIFLKTSESCHLSTRQANVTVSVGAPVILNCSCVYPNGSGTAGFVRWVRKNQTIFRQKNITHWQWRNVSDQSKRESSDFSITKLAMLSDAGVYSCQFWKKNSPDVLNGTVNVTLSVNAAFSTESSNFWLHLAATTNTSFCVSTADSPSRLLANNLTGIPSSREEFTNMTGLNITSLEVDDDTRVLFTVPWQLNRTSYREFDLLNGMRAPKGWAFLCSQYAFPLLAPDDFRDCSLGRVAPMLTSVFSETRRRRSLPEDCDDTVILLGEDTAFIMAVSLVGVPGLAYGNTRGLRKLACLVTETVNLTAAALSNVAEELDQVRSGVLLNRAAVDYLLLKDHISWESVPGGCFNMVHVSYVESVIEKHMLHFTLKFITNPLSLGGFQRIHWLLMLAGLLLLFLLCMGCFPCVLQLMLTLLQSVWTEIHHLKLGTKPPL